MANKGTQLHPVNSLQGGDYLTSTPNGTCRLTMEASTGDLDTSSPGTWHSGTSGNPGARCTMLGNGDVGIYRTDGTKLKHSNTGTHPGAYLSVDDNGNVHIRDTDGSILFTNFPMYAWNAPALRLPDLLETAKVAVEALHAEVSRIGLVASGSAAVDADQPREYSPRRNGSGSHDQPRG